MLISKWVKEFQVTEKSKVGLDDLERKAIAEIVNLLNKSPESDTIQNQIFESAKSNNIPPSKLFSKLYNILIGTDRGPRLGPYLVDTGTKKAAKLLSEQL
ncbi:MAG: lysine--tRNA ligase, partial [Candidatus Hydrothermarchaeota archaeon]|nr:lysine--tRNA ligase [Candidatus Hydrothermarchaeota archaeon]